MRIDTGSLEGVKSLGRDRDLGEGGNYSLMSFLIRRYIPGIYGLIGVIIVRGERVLKLPATIASDDIIKEGFRLGVC